MYQLRAQLRQDKAHANLKPTNIIVTANNQVELQGVLMSRCAECACLICIQSCHALMCMPGLIP